MLNKAIKISVVIFLVFSVLTYVTNSEPFSQKKTKELELQRGKTLTIVNGCVYCHSPKIVTEVDLIPDPERLFSGHPQDEVLPEVTEDLVGENKWFGLYTTGFTAWGGPWGVTYAANLTPDKETGIGTWSEENFISIISLGIHSSLNRKLMPPMPWDEFAQLSEDDLKAIFKYLKTLKPIKNKVPESVPLVTHENLALEPLIIE